MNINRRDTKSERSLRSQASNARRKLSLAIVTAISWLTAETLLASENVPHMPFAIWADLPVQGQFVAGIVYAESEAYHIYVNGQSHNVTWHAAGESYGIDINQGFLTFQYGITPQWAVDLNVGATTIGWRYFSSGTIEDTTGLMDTSFGVRYQLLNETNSAGAWTPTLTLRAGGVAPGTYNASFPFAPGVHSWAVEPEALARKHFGWPGFGAFGDLLFRWNFTPDNGQYIAAVGLFQQIKGWELDVGYRHLQTLSGEDIFFNPAQPSSLVYPRDVREINDALDVGFSYTTKRRLRFGFQCRTTLGGNNSDQKFWVGGSFEIPFGGRK
jgi:hypothetical protein